MSTKEKIDFLRNHLDSVDDEFLNTVYELMMSHLEIETNSHKLTDNQKKELDIRVENHKTEKSKSYSWGEVKQSLGL